MFTRIITNHVKEGMKEEYIKVSLEFMEELKANCGMIEGRIYEVEGRDLDVLNFETWPDREAAEASGRSEVFRNFLPRLLPCFAGNETTVLIER